MLICNFSQLFVLVILALFLLFSGLLRSETTPRVQISRGRQTLRVQLQLAFLQEVQSAAQVEWFGIISQEARWSHHVVIHLASQCRLTGMASVVRLLPCRAVVAGRGGLAF